MPEAERDCFVWVLPRAELARLRGDLPRGALLLECTPVAAGEDPPPEFEDRVAVGSFEVCGTKLSFMALSESRLDAACLLVEERLSWLARLIRREVTDLDVSPGTGPARRAGPVAVVLLLRGIENHAERARRRGEAFPDTAWMRRELGLDLAA